MCDELKLYVVVMLVLFYLCGASMALWLHLKTIDLKRAKEGYEQAKYCSECGNKRDPLTK